VSSICTHTHPFNGPLSRTTRVSRYQKSTTNLDFTEARDSEWQWHQLGHIQVCTLLQTDNHASPHHSVFSGQMLFQLPNQQRQSTGGQISSICNVIILMLSLKFTCVAYSSKAFLFSGLSLLIYDHAWFFTAIAALMTLISCSCYIVHISYCCRQKLYLCHTKNCVISIVSKSQLKWGRMHCRHRLHLK